MLNKNKKKKYRHYIDSIDDDNGSESEYEKGNIDLIINKLENKLNTGNINSGNADVILKIPQKNEETRRSSKISEGIIKNIPQLLENKNIKEKDNELSQENCESSMENGMKISNNSLVDIDLNINVNNNLKENLEKNENNKSDLILSTNNSHKNTDMNSNILSRNKLTNINENNLSKLSIHLDNSRYFLGKRNNLGLISLNKNNDAKNNKDNKKENNIKNDMKKEKKRERMRNNNIIMKKRNKITFGYKFKLFWNDFFDERTWRRRCRNCNIVTIIRDIFITIIVVSALAFYATIFIVG